MPFLDRVNLLLIKLLNHGLRRNRQENSLYAHRRGLLNWRYDLHRLSGPAMTGRACSFALVSALLFPLAVQAGLYYSGETYAELPSQWRGFMLDHRILYTIGITPGPKNPVGPARTRYQEHADRLETKARAAKLSADELADLGALYVRLGEPGKTVALLRTAQLEHRNHFCILANLGTACQLQGDLSQAALYLQQAVRLAPGKLQEAEEYHLRLVQLRLKKQNDGVDNLFGVRFLGEKGAYEPGRMAKAEREKLPARAVAVAQQMALWLPRDGRLLWQLAELANATGDVRAAAAMMDGCVTQFGINDPELRRHRRLTRAAADELAKREASQPHAKQASALKARSQRPLVAQLDQASLPPISATGINNLPWDVLSQTTVDGKFHPTFVEYLRKLDGKTVAVNGYIQPLRDDAELSAFMFIEYPVGCWYCEMPAVTGIVYVELPAGRSTVYRRGLVRVTGRLQLNATDPEDFLYAIRAARVTEVD
jgi:hypothetical protein